MFLPMILLVIECILPVAALLWNSRTAQCCNAHAQNHPALCEQARCNANASPQADPACDEPAPSKLGASIAVPAASGFAAAASESSLAPTELDEPQFEPPDAGAVSSQPAAGDAAEVSKPLTALRSAPAGHNSAPLLYHVPDLAQPHADVLPDSDAFSIFAAHAASSRAVHMQRTMHS